MALLVLLARAARAWIVASNFFLRAHDLLHRGRIPSASHACLLQFAPLAAHEGLLQFVGGSRHHARRTLSIAIAATQRGHARLGSMARRAGLRTCRTSIGRPLQN